VILQLHAIAYTRLFGDGPWLADRESGSALSRTFLDMALEEAVPENPGASRSTSLGKELKIELLSTFAGHWEPYDLIYNLEEHVLLTEEQADQLRRQLDRGADPEAVLRPYVQRAYVKYYGRCN